MKNDNRMKLMNRFGEQLAKKLEERPRISDRSPPLQPVRIHRVEPQGYISGGTPKIHRSAS